jgi:amino acid permease
MSTRLPIPQPRNSSLSSYRSNINSWSSSYKKASTYLSNRGESLDFSNRGDQQSLDEDQLLDSESAIDADEEISVEQPLLPSAVHVHQSTFAQSCFNSINILVGVGLLSLPYSFKITGWIIGVGALLFFSFVTRHTALILAKCLDYDQDGCTRSDSFGDIGQKAFGTIGRSVISLIFLFELVAACVALIILAADSILALFPFLSVVWIKITIALLLFPVILYRSLSLVAWGSFVGVIALVNLLIILIYDGLTTLESPGSLLSPCSTQVIPSAVFNVPFSFGLIMAGFAGHSVLPNIYRDMKNPAEYPKLVNWTFCITTLIYLSISGIGYLMFGALVKEEITQNLPLVPTYNPILNQMTVILISLNPITKYPLAISPLNAQIEYMLWKKSTRTARLATCALTTVLILGLAIAFPGFHKIMALLGSFFSFTVSVIFPELCYLKLYGKSMSLADLMFERTIAAIGVIFAIFGTVWAFLPLNLQS